MTHDVTISAFDLDYLEKELAAARFKIELLETNLEISFRQTEQAVQDRADEHKILIEQGDKLAENAVAVVNRWETPNWKNAPATAEYIYRLRDVLMEWKEARK